MTIVKSQLTAIDLGENQNGRNVERSMKSQLEVTPMDRTSILEDLTIPGRLYRQLNSLYHPNPV